jgi:hypothetical protein
MATSKNTVQITPEQIIAHRELRKKAGMVGCVTGRPVPEMDFFGYRDVQVWNVDANGRMNGDPGFDRKNPHCFCFDCRGAFDPRAEVDAELVNSGNERACHVYASLLMVPTPVVSPPPPPPRPSPALAPMVPHGPLVPLPPRTMTEHPEAYARGVPRSTWFPSSPPLAAGGRPPPIEIPPLSEVPTSLPAPRHRDIMNESRETRIKKDLLQQIMHYRGELVEVIDSRRSAAYIDQKDAREDYLAKVSKKENDLWDKIRACELLIEDLDA